MLELLTRPEIKARIEQKQHLILPQTWWSGVKKRVETIEVLEDEEFESLPGIAVTEQPVGVKV